MADSERKMTPEERLRECILYISEKCKDDPTFCMEKLLGILWAADITAYRKRGKSITGCEWYKPSIEQWQEMIGRELDEEERKDWDPPEASVDSCGSSDSLPTTDS